MTTRNKRRIAAKTEREREKERELVEKDPWEYFAMRRKTGGGGWFPLDEAIENYPHRKIFTVRPYLLRVPTPRSTDFWLKHRGRVFRRFSANDKTARLDSGRDETRLNKEIGDLSIVPPSFQILRRRIWTVFHLLRGKKLTYWKISSSISRVTDILLLNRHARMERSWKEKASRKQISINFPHD